MAQTLAAEVADYPWYHTLDLGDGVVTSGMFDHRPVLEHYPLPDDLSGLRCLDVGTMDGFWAFEMERRGAAEVVAVDAPDPLALDWPASLRATAEKTLDETKEERFALAHRALGSRVRRVARSVYDIDPEQLGSFDVVFCGDLLVHLRDPVGGARADPLGLLRQRDRDEPDRALRDPRQAAAGAARRRRRVRVVDDEPRRAREDGARRGLLERRAEPDVQAAVRWRGSWKGLRGVVRALP